jgi:hypothetical protein
MENEKEKEALLREIENLLSFDGHTIDIHPDYLAYFTLEELRGIEKRLRESQEKMVEIHKEWFMGLAKPS